METREATPSTTVVYSKPNCPSCVKAFHINAKLKRHIQQGHGNQRNHKCESCEKSIHSKGNLMVHSKNVHRNEM